MSAIVAPPVSKTLVCFQVRCADTAVIGMDGSKSPRVANVLIVWKGSNSHASAAMTRSRSSRRRSTTRRSAAAPPENATGSMFLRNRACTVLYLASAPANSRSRCRNIGMASRGPKACSAAKAAKTSAGRQPKARNAPTQPYASSNIGRRPCCTKSCNECANVSASATSTAGLAAPGSCKTIARCIAPRRNISPYNHDERPDHMSFARLRVRCLPARSKANRAPTWHKFCATAQRHLLKSFASIAVTIWGELLMILKHICVRAARRATSTQHCRRLLRPFSATPSKNRSAPTGERKPSTASADAASAPCTEDDFRLASMPLVSARCTPASSRSRPRT
mmetsp:Transcript_42954/g.129749  ORF Transcript_42954/g.129749 Transcript_42954/m.129749 type:complete len:337 (+) Transcript_42954:177-1187(+)